MLLNHLTQEAYFFPFFFFLFCVCCCCCFLGGCHWTPQKQQQHQTNMNTDVVFNRLSMEVLPDHRAICVSRGACVDYIKKRNPAVSSACVRMCMCVFVK